jgi:hypothetical protein
VSDSNINLNLKNEAIKKEKLNIIKLSYINYFQTLIFNKKYYIFDNIIQIFSFNLNNNKFMKLFFTILYFRKKSIGHNENISLSRNEHLIF